MRHFGRPLDVRYKSPDQPLTDADLEADRLLHEDLVGACPDYGWLSEETVDTADRLDRKRVWIVDPIDGTRSFIAAVPEFTVSIGLAEDGAAVAGVVYNPAKDELYHAVRGGGAFCSVRGAEPVRLEVRREAVDTEVTLFASRTEIGAGELAGFSEAWRIEPVGSTAYKLARVAASPGSAFLSRGPKSEWDICAGVLIVAEAGGFVTDLTGVVPEFNRPDPYVHGVIAANEALHAVLRRKVEALPPRRRSTRQAR